MEKSTPTQIRQIKHGGLKPKEYKPYGDGRTRKKKERLIPRYRRRDGAAIPLLAVVIVVVAVLAVAIVVVAWSGRDDGWANDPGEPPSGSSGEPFKQGQFVFSVEYHKAGTNHLEIYQHFMGPLEDYEGAPWSLSLFPGSSHWLSGDDYGVDYELTLTKGAWKYEDDGSFDVYKSEEYQECGHKSNYFFFWPEQKGEWHYRLFCKCEGKSDIAEGGFTVS